LVIVSPGELFLKYCFAVKYNDTVREGQNGGGLVRGHAGSHGGPPGHRHAHPARPPPTRDIIVEIAVLDAA
jgi:hypothetical protein